MEVRNKERKRKRKRRKKRICGFENNLKSLTHFSIPIDNHFNNSSINLNINLSLSLSLWMKTQTHTQFINIYHINHHQDISSTTTIHVHSFSFYNQHTQSLSQNNHFSSQSSKSISSSLLCYSSLSHDECMTTSFMFFELFFENCDHLLEM